MLIPREGETPPEPDPPDENKKPPEKIKNLYKQHYKNSSYLVIVEANEETEKNIGKCSHLKIAKEICELNLNNVYKINIKGKNKISVEFNNYISANKLTNDERLKNKGYNVYIPYNQVSCKGIIRNIDLELTEEKIQKLIQAPYKILEVRRLNRKIVKTNENKKEVEYAPTGTVLLTFEGTILPRYVSIYSLEFPVNIYIPPATQCLSCLMFGHISKQCRGKAKCKKCGWVIDELKGGINNHECSEKCYFCKSSEHNATSKNCPEFMRQTAIRRVMVFENISYFDASKLCKKTYVGNENMEYKSQPADFPVLPKVTQDNNNIKITQRREIVTEPGIRGKRTYGEAVSESPRKKISVQSKTNYNQNEIDNNLYFPNSRPAKMLEKQPPIYNRPNYTQPGSSTMDDFQNTNIAPFSAQQQYIQENVKKIYDFFMQIPDSNKIQIKELIPILFVKAIWI